MDHLINDENYAQLELGAVLHRLKKFISTPYGLEKFEEIQPSRSKPELQRMLDETEEMLQLLQLGNSVPFELELPDVRKYLDWLKPEDSFLETEQLLEIRQNLDTFIRVRRFLENHLPESSLLRPYANRLHVHKKLIDEIDAAIDERGEIRENASPELRRIRNAISHLENEQKQLLSRLLKRYSEFSQDEIMTLRDGRMVLGIQPQYVNRVSGIVHGTSGSGATIFIEPMETLRIGNQIQNLKIEERQEIIRILKFLSGLIREIRMDIAWSAENLGILDLIHARARLALEMNAVKPELSDKPFLKLIKARHPVLLLKMGHQNVVPCTVSLGDEYYTLVITGPNAGGKTVALKTVGLMVVMTQLGLLIPVREGSVVPLLDRILVDIGDQQSLEQDLSTFSAHILRLQEILRQADTHTLVLVDEVGSGTDPREGAALATAFLQELTERKTLTIATTHHGELKAFAYHTPGVENASMEFNIHSLQPTYRMQIGIPGSSYAFEIAQRYGFSESVLKRAQQIVGEEKGQLEQLILDLNEKMQAVEEERRQLSIRLSEAEGLRNLYEKQAAQIKEKRKELEKQAAEEANKILADVNARIERLVAEIRKTGADRQSIKNAREEVKRLKKTTREKLAKAEKPAEPEEPLQKGDIVWVELHRQEGELVTEPNNKGKVWVLINDLRVQMDVSQLKKLRKKEAERRYAKSDGSRIDKSIREGIKPELDLRGMDSLEAIEATNRYLDMAVEEGWEEVRIIHGKGTGVLRKKINDYLQGDRRVEEKRLGRWGEGDTGVTIVKLKKGN